VVVKLVHRRIGELPEGTEGRLAALDIPALDALLEAVMDAPDDESVRTLLPHR
jgi:hypothetical protein